MKAHYFIAILLCLYGFSQVNAQCGGELGSVDGEGIVNANDPEQISTFDWLYKGFSSTANHPDNADPSPGPGGGEDCEFGIQISGRDGMDFDSAFYSKSHNEADEIRFRFILDTENLLQGFVTDDKIVLYRFMYTSEGIDSPFLKIRLIKSDSLITNHDWELRLQWVDIVNSGSSHQRFYFNEADNFVEFEFFWNKRNATNNSGIVLFSKQQAGVMVKAGLGTKPVLMISPYDYEGALTNDNLNLEGKSALGYINANTSPAYEGDEIRIISPNLYNN